MTLPELEKRVADMEDEIASLKNKVDSIESDVPWWERIAGTFSDDLLHAKAMELGRDYRQSLGPENASGGKQT